MLVLEGLLKLSPPLVSIFVPVLQLNCKKNNIYASPYSILIHDIPSAGKAPLPFTPISIQANSVFQIPEAMLSPS